MYRKSIKLLYFCQCCSHSCYLKILETMKKERENKKRRETQHHLTALRHILKPQLCRGGQISGASRTINICDICTCSYIVWASNHVIITSLSYFSIFEMGTPKILATL
jgi:hypothetical protein